MASTGKLNLLSQSVTATVNGETKGMIPKSSRFVLFQKVTDYSGTLNVTTKVQHSPDSTNWIDLETFTAFTANTFEAVQVSNKGIFPHVRAVSTVNSGAGSATVLVDIFFDSRGGNG